MNVLEAIRTVDGMKPNAFTDEQKLMWLNELEGRVRVLVHLERPENVTGYSLPDDEQTKLLIPFPFDSVYWKWLSAMIDLGNGEYDKYANSMSVANSAYQDYAKWHLRENGGTTK